jgi:hypothetical protein
VDIPKPGFEQRESRAGSDPSMRSSWFEFQQIPTLGMVSALHHTLHSWRDGSIRDRGPRPRPRHRDRWRSSPHSRRAAPIRSNGSLHGDIFWEFRWDGTLTPEGADVVGELQESVYSPRYSAGRLPDRGVEFGNRAKTEQANRAAGKLLTDSSAADRSSAWVRHRGGGLFAVRPPRIRSQRSF